MRCSNKNIMGGDMNSAHIYDNYKCLVEYKLMRKDVLI